MNWCLLSQVQRCKRTIVAIICRIISERLQLVSCEGELLIRYCLTCLAIIYWLWQLCLNITQDPRMGLGCDCSIRKLMLTVFFPILILCIHSRFEFFYWFFRAQLSQLKMMNSLATMFCLLNRCVGVCVGTLHKLHFLALLLDNRIKMTLEALFMQYVLAVS